MRAFTPPRTSGGDLLPERLETGPDPHRDAAEPPRLELLRPIECLLTTKDFTLVERHLLEMPAAARRCDRLLLRLIRTKLADARIVLSDDIAPDVATGNSRLVYSVDDEPERTGVLRHWEHEGDQPTAVQIRSLLGMTLIGMTTGQNAPLVREDGRIGHVRLLAVVFQPEAARRALPG